jgi:hypothetical protein
LKIRCAGEVKEQEVAMLPPWIIDRIDSEKRRREREQYPRTWLEIDPRPQQAPPPPADPPRRPVVIEV